ncbi:hypothetical protein IQ227_03500 [Anabaena aphanizomenioides LEGE 00250]|uniref:Uncharacterized protein n=1 Tax=Sphaerospermopsis aphanizomenoides LEGE 00250 TaxID=2777972 RepID=A0ABR9V9I1_9CYAN|nr:hypothetical protein [Sphaerospermopsis aphanizomenoides]MBE9235129.1 hypothetical protein [Sphaerospermopsis aphanizomenoides LEGE 00250]
MRECRRGRGAGSRGQGKLFVFSQSPVTNHQSPVTNHQSPVPNHQKIR